MSVTIDVRADLDHRSVQNSARDMQRQFQTAAMNAGKDFGDNIAAGIERSTPRVERAMGKAADAVGKYRTEQAKLTVAQKSAEQQTLKVVAAQERVNELRAAGADGTKNLARAEQELATAKERAGRADALIVAQSERLASARRNQSSAVRTVAREMEQVSNSTQDAVGDVAEFGRLMGGLGKAAGPVGLTVLAAGIVDIASAAAAAAQSVWVLPAALTAAGAGFGTLKLATLGFGDALESMGDPAKFAEALGNLAPNAQQSAIAIKTLVDGPIKDMRMATQDALFEGVGSSLTSLSAQYLPTIQEMTTSIAGSFNTMFMGVAGVLAQPEVQATVQGITSNIATAFQNAAPAVASFSQAFLDITSVGADMLPELATGAADLAAQFADFISEARQSGEMRQWLQDGLDAVREIAEIAWSAGEAFMSLADRGSERLPEIAQEAKEVAGAFQTVADWVQTVDQGIQTLGNSINLIINPLQGLRGFGEQLGLIDPAAAPTEYGGGGGSFPRAPLTPAAVPTGPWESLSPADRWLAADAARLPGGGQQTPAGSGTFRRRDGSIGYAQPPSARDNGLQPAFTPSQNSGSAGVSDSERRANIRAGLDPNAFAVNPFSAMAQVPGFQPGYGTQEQIQAQQRAQSEAWDVQEAKMDLAVLEQDSLSTEQELNDARRKVTEEGWQLQNAQAAMLEAVQGQAKDFSTSMSDIGAQLDSDLGISKGLPGIADNIVRFVASLAAAPLLGPLAAISQANGGESATGSGIIGMLGANGAFGEQYTASYQASAMGPAALQPGSAYTGYSGDGALLSRVPSGTYTQSGRGDLTQGLADCSSAVEDLVNMLDGRPTAGASMSTHNADQWLQDRGFIQGAGGPGDMRVAFNSGHMQATLPGGTPFNWGSPAAAARGGVGGSGADDPALTSRYYRPAGGSSYAPLTGPALTNPGLTTPVPSGGGGGGYAGIPFPQSMPGAQQFPGTAQPAQGAGQGGMSSFMAGQQPSGGAGGGFQGMGGAPMDALLGAAGMADMLAPGAGAAAQIGMKLANRAIGQMGQYAGIGVSGLMETLSVGNTPLSNPGKSWLGKLAGGFAGARPALPNNAGGVGGNQAKDPAQKTPNQPGQSAVQAGQQGPMVNIEQYNVGETEDRAGADLARHQQASALSSQPRR